MSAGMLRLIASPDQKRPGSFIAYLETGDALVAGSRQPLMDGARELLAHSFDPAALLTMRIEGKSYDSFAPLPALPRRTPATAQHTPGGGMSGFASLQAAYAEHHIAIYPLAAAKRLLSGPTIESVNSQPVVNRDTKR